MNNQDIDITFRVTNINADGKQFEKGKSYSYSDSTDNILTYLFKIQSQEFLARRKSTTLKSSWTSTPISMK